VFHHVFEFGNLLKRYGSTRFAFDAANALALLKVTAKFLGDNVGGKQDFAYLEDGREGVSHNVELVVRS
jgi:hypothetical protein